MRPEIWHYCTQRKRAVGKKKKVLASPATTLPTGVPGDADDNSLCARRGGDYGDSRDCCDCCCARRDGGDEKKVKKSDYTVNLF